MWAIVRLEIPITFRVQEAEVPFTIMSKVAVAVLFVGGMTFAPLQVAVK